MDVPLSCGCVSLNRHSIGYGKCLVGSQDKSGRSVLHHAASNGQLGILSHVHDNFGQELFMVKDSLGRTVGAGLDTVLILWVRAIPCGCYEGC